jgi:hypothetical protein
MMLEVGFAVANCHFTGAQALLRIFTDSSASSHTLSMATIQTPAGRAGAFDLYPIERLPALPGRTAFRGCPLSGGDGEDINDGTAVFPFDREPL